MRERQYDDDSQVVSCPLPLDAPSWCKAAVLQEVPYDYSAGILMTNEDYVLPVPLGNSRSRDR